MWVPLIGSVSELACVKGRRDFVADLLTEGLRKVRIFPSLWIECSKKPKLVLLKCATQIKACINLRETVRSRSCKRKILSFTNHPLGSEVRKDIAVQVIPSTLGEDIENATHC
jgi:hypothetical protein